MGVARVNVQIIKHVKVKQNQHSVWKFIEAECLKRFPKETVNSPVLWVHFPYYDSGRFEDEGL